MYLLLWIITFPSILYHTFFVLLLIFIFVYHKISHHLFKKPSSFASANHYQKYIKEKQNNLLRMCNHKFAKLSSANHSTSSKSKINNSTTHVALVILGLVLICQLNENGSVKCLEADAILLKPLADVAKSLISAVTTGKPLKIDIKSTDLARSFVSFSWRTGFPINLPTGFIEKGQQFYNRLLQRVLEADVGQLQRKRLVNLKVDLDNIVDSLVEHVRQSQDGLYSNWLDARVNETSIEDAIYNVGLQLKAYKIDISNYRNIAGVVLGVPVVPTVAKHVVSAGKAAAPITQLPGSAFNTVSQMSGSAINSLTNQIPSSMSGYFPYGNPATAQAMVNSPSQEMIQGPA